MKLRTLRGLRIVVTRAAHQASELAEPLLALGAEAILLPLIGIAPPDDRQPLQAAAADAQQYDWVLFTSANAITSFMAELPESSGWFRPRVATIGAATREVAEEYGLRVSLTPDTYVAESLIHAFHGVSLQGKRILIPSAAVTRDIVPAELRKLGAEVDVVQAYQNVLPWDAPARAKQVFSEPLPNWVTFASSSAVDNLTHIVEQEILQQVRIATIGPVTSDTVRAHGLEVSAEASVHSMDGLIKALQSASF
jgi:uroporphyrinogen III methyltransferase/synthase